jgi:hypothetical protein
MPSHPASPEDLPSEVVMLCSLLARIIFRCLKERDPRLLARLGLSASTQSGTQTPTHESATH